MSAGDCKVEMEIHVRHAASSKIGDRRHPIGHHHRNSMNHNGNGPASISSVHVEEEEGGSISGDDYSSSDEQQEQQQQPIPLKRNRLKNGKEAKKKKNNNLDDLPSGGSSSSVIPLCTNSRDTSDDHQQDDDEGSGASLKEGGVSTSFTSGENSDADGGAEGEDHIGVKQDVRKCFECDVCNMQFSNGANMRRHRMRHTGVKPYECRVCQKRFFRKDHLAEHSATHSKLLPFRCPICNKGFQRQIAMRAHFQNEHVGGSHENMGMKACPLCSYKACSMKSLRVHFRSRHGIDLDNPVPHSPSLCTSNERTSGSPGPNNAEFSELAQALGFEHSEKSTDSIKFPSHFLVPQIEISSNSPYPAHFAQFSADSSYSFHAGHGSSSSPPNVSPQSDSSHSNLPSSSDLVSVVVKKEVPDDLSSEHGESKSKDSDNSDVQDVPEDLSSGNSNLLRPSQGPKCCSSSLSKVSALKSLLREDLRKDSHASSNGAANTNNNNSGSRSRSDSSGHSGSGYHAQAYEAAEDISSSISAIDSGTTHSMYSRRGMASFPNHLHHCVYCGIIFPDKTLYFLHKGCHSESSPWKCNICGHSCLNVYDFNSHLLSKSHQ